MPKVAQLLTLFKTQLLLRKHLSVSVGAGVFRENLIFFSIFQFFRLNKFNFEIRKTHTEAY